MLPLLQIGSLTIRTPGLALLAGLWIGLEVASREGVRRGIDGDKIYNLGFYTLIAGILGARLGFVLLNLDLYTGITPWARALLSVFALATGTENPWIGVLAAVGTAAFLVRRWKLPPLAILDSFAPAFAILGIGIGLANLLSGDYYGIETTLPWGINLWGSKRQPTQIYFIVACIAILIVLWRLRPMPSPAGKRSGKAKRSARESAQNDRPEGFPLQIFLIMFGFATLLIEPLRADSPVIGPGIRLWEVIGLTGAALSLVGFAIRAPEELP